MSWAVPGWTSLFLRYTIDTTRDDDNECFWKDIKWILKTSHERLMCCAFPSLSEASGPPDH